MLPHQPAKFKAVRQCIHNNYLFIKSLLGVYDETEASPSHLSQANAAASEHARKQPQVHPGDMEKVRYDASGPSACHMCLHSGCAMHVPGKFRVAWDGT